MRYAVLCAWLTACVGSQDPGLQAEVILPGALFYHGAMPTGDGPSVTTAALTRSQLIRGKVSTLFGNVPIGTGGILVGAPGDIGYWGLIPGARDPLLPNQLAFANDFAIAQKVPLGAFTVNVVAVGTDGKPGAVNPVVLQVQDFAIPGAKMTISLDWDTDSDLDLHVVEPSGYELWPKRVSNPGADGDYHDDGYLDADSNSGCLIDGRRQENALWVNPPTAGTYLIRVDTFSLCNQSYANWRIRVSLDGNVVSTVTGVSRPSDTRFAHGPGAGVYATYVTVAP